MSTKDRDLLDRAKRDVDLPGWFSTLGWVADPEKDSRRSRAMRGPDGTRVVITQQPDGHWTFFDPTNDRNSGTIFDAAALYANAATSGQQFRECRRALENPPAPVPVIYATATRATATGSTQRPPAHVVPLDAEGAEYLTSRGLSTTTIEAFSHALSTVQGRGVQARHNRTGGEERGEDHRHFSGGNADDGPARGRSAWIAMPASGERPTAIIVAESFIDSLSAWQMLPTTEQATTAVVSTGGSLCPASLTKLTHALERIPGVMVLDASDQGEAGTDRRTTQLREAVEAAGASYARHSPPEQAKDWNDALRAVQAALAATWLPAADEDEQTQSLSL